MGEAEGRGGRRCGQRFRSIMTVGLNGVWGGRGESSGGGRGWVNGLVRNGERDNEGCVFFIIFW